MTNETGGKSHPRCERPHGHTCQQPSGRTCVERGCDSSAELAAALSIPPEKTQA